MLVQYTSKTTIKKFIEITGAPGAIRTPGLLIRSQMLYPAELRVQIIS